MSGKGSAPRPFSVDAKTFASNWDAIFRGVPEKSNGASSNLVSGVKPAAAGANPATAAIYVDDATDAQVTEAWWPGDKHDG